MFVDKFTVIPWHGKFLCFTLKSQSNSTFLLQKFYACPRYLQIWKNLIKNKRKGWDIVFPIISQWVISVAMETEFWSNLSQNLMQPFPHPNDASYKIWPTLANWPQRYSSFIWIMTEWQNHRIPEGQGKSSIAPTFSKWDYKYPPYLFYWYLSGREASIRIPLSGQPLYDRLRFCESGASLPSQFSHQNVRRHLHLSRWSSIPVAGFLVLLRELTVFSLPVI